MCSERFIWMTVIGVEASYIVITRLLLSLEIYGFEAEFIRTGLRFVCIAIYWLLLGSYLSSRTVNLKACVNLTPFFAFALFLSAPLLVGDLSYMGTDERVLYAATSIVVAVKEEIAYRGVIQRLLATRFGELNAIIVATILFTAYHIGGIPNDWFAYGQVIIASLFLGIVFARTQSLLLVVLLHTLYDSLWSLTPVLSEPFPMFVGIIALLFGTATAVFWGWPAIRLNSNASWVKKNAGD